MRTFISIDLLWRWSIFIRIIGVLKSFWVRDNRALFHPQFPIPAAATLHLCPCGLRGLLLLLLSVDRWWRGIRVCRHRMRTSPGPIKEGDISSCNEAGERIARSLTRMGILYRKKHVGTWVYDSAASELSRGAVPGVAVCGTKGRHTEATDFDTTSDGRVYYESVHSSAISITQETQFFNPIIYCILQGYTFPPKLVSSVRCWLGERRFLMTKGLYVQRRSRKG